MAPPKPLKGHGVLSIAYTPDTSAIVSDTRDNYPQKMTPCSFRGISYRFVIEKCLQELNYSVTQLMCKPQPDITMNILFQFSFFVMYL